MTTKKKTLFRPAIDISNIHQVAEEDRDPNYFYKYVSLDYRHDKNRVKRYLNMGWEIVETTKQTLDDRSFTPNTKEEKLRPQPDVITTRDGVRMMLLRITHEQKAQNEADKAAHQDLLHKKQLAARGGRQVQKGNDIRTIEAEVNETNI